MPELSCCQLTCHSLHAAPGLAGWGEAGAGEPARPLSCGRGSEQVGSCLSQDPCSCFVRWNAAVGSVRHIQMYFLPFLMTSTEAFSVVVVTNWECSAWGSTRLWGWVRLAQPCSQPENQRLAVLGRPSRQEISRKDLPVQLPDLAAR